MRAVYLAVLAIAATSAPAMGAVTGWQLAEWCRSDNELGAACSGYIYGALDSLDFAYSRGVKKIYCLPQEDNQRKPTIGLVRDLFLSSIEANPKLSSLPATLLIAGALSEPFPCKGGGR